MNIDDEHDKIKEKKLCHQCIGDEHLKSEIQDSGKRQKCSYCGQNAKS